jgi:hypothetical protein
MGDVYLLVIGVTVLLVAVLAYDASRGPDRDE